MMAMGGRVCLISSPLSTNKEFPTGQPAQMEKSTLVKKKKHFAELFSDIARESIGKRSKCQKSRTNNYRNATKPQFFPIAVNHRWCLVVLAQIITFAKHPPILIFHKLSLLLLILTTCNTLFLFSCLGQLNRWPCHSVSKWVSQTFDFRDTSRH